MRKQAVFFCFGLGILLLNACTPQASQFVSATDESSPPTAVQKTSIPSSHAETETPQPINSLPETIQPSGITFPIFVYPLEHPLMMQIGDNSPDPIGDFTDLGEIRDALLIGDTLHLLQENGIRQIHLIDYSDDVLLYFDEPISSGRLVLDTNFSRVFYNGITHRTRDTLIGYFEIDGNSVHPMLLYKDPLITLQIIGVTEDGQGLYCLPVGQDPEFGKVLLLNIEQGMISKELAVQGWSYAVLAPNSRHLATFSRIPDTSDQMTNMINIYDLPSLPLTSPRVFTLPNPPSGVGFGGLYWSPDSQKLYFMLTENIDDPSSSISYGLWCLDVNTGSASQVAAIPDPILHLSGINPDGRWGLLKAETKDEIYLVDLPSGEIRSLVVPLEAILVGWQ